MSPLLKAGLIAAAIYIPLLAWYIRQAIKNPDSC